MQARIPAVLLLQLVAVIAAAPLAADERRPDHPSRSRGQGAPSIVIEPEVFIDGRRQPEARTPDDVMADIEACVAAGVRLFVDCLRHSHGSIMIRRLEACLRSETIPDDPAEVEACVAVVARP